EYYTAKLTAILGLSLIPVYPKTLIEFANSPIPLLVSHSNDYQYLLDNPEVYSKTIEWNFSEKYDPTGLALLQLCDLFPFTIDDTTDHLGKRLTYHHYHLIEEPISTAICLSPFRKTSPRLERFQLYVTRLHEAGIWNHLVKKWMLKDGHVLPDFKVQERTSFKSSILELLHFVPVMPYHTSYVNINLAYPSSLSPPPAIRTNIPSIVIEFSAEKISNIGNSILISYLFNYLHVKRTEKKIIVLIVANDSLRITALAQLASTFSSYGALDVLFVIVYTKTIQIVRFNNAINNYVLLSSNASVNSLFPERFLDLGGRPYVVAWFENEPMSFLRNNDVVGVDVDFINIIAKHQNTYVEYIINAPDDPHTVIDFATYRLVDSIYWSKHASPLYFPNQYR
uniref:Uncharacterized protein n=1 Tax=Anopheles maculatus TaxID=74869 RepID=A0A182SSE5_9DIPT